MLLLSVMFVASFDVVISKCIVHSDIGCVEIVRCRLMRPPLNLQAVFVSSRHIVFKISSSILSYILSFLFRNCFIFYFSIFLLLYKTETFIISSNLIKEIWEQNI